MARIAIKHPVVSRGGHHIPDRDIFSWIFAMGQKGSGQESIEPAIERSNVHWAYAATMDCDKVKQGIQAHD
jgi:hypothetical protein